MDPRRPTLVELLQADISKMSAEELRIHRSRLSNWRKKDFHQMLEDETLGRPEHEGFIYVLSHEAMPGLLKIGFTSGPVEKRVAEISASTGVPGPFKIERKFPVYEDPAVIERKIHSMISFARKNDKREFFSLTVEEAERFIHAVIDKRT